MRQPTALANAWLRLIRVPVDTLENRAHVGDPETAGQGVSSTSFR